MVINRLDVTWPLVRAFINEIVESSISILQMYISLDQLPSIMNRRLACRMFPSLTSLVIFCAHVSLERNLHGSS